MIPITSLVVESMDICLETGMHTISLVDTYGDGWSSGSFVSITETATSLSMMADMLIEGYNYENSFNFWVGPAPIHPPPPPLDPPGMLKHEACHLHIRGTRGPTITGGAQESQAAHGGL